MPCGKARIALQDVAIGDSGMDKVTIVETINDNMPFLLDSTLAEIAEHGLSLRLVAHPILSVDRDPSGAFVALQGEEASVVAPYFQAGPLFGYGLAYLVLGETLSSRQMIGGVLILLGALFVSIRFEHGLRLFKLALRVAVVLVRLDNRLDGGAFLRKLGNLRVVAQGIRVGKQAVKLVISGFDPG